MNYKQREVGFHFIFCFIAMSVVWRKRLFLNKFGNDHCIGAGILLCLVRSNIELFLIMVSEEAINNHKLASYRIS